MDEYTERTCVRVPVLSESMKRICPSSSLRVVVRGLAATVPSELIAVMYISLLMWWLWQSRTSSRLHHHHHHRHHTVNMTTLWYVFTVRLHVMQRTVLLLKFCPSVRPSVRCVYCDKTKQRTANILIPHETAITLVFWHQQWLMGDAPFPLNSALKVTHPPSKNADFDRFPLIRSQP